MPFEWAKWGLAASILGSLGGSKMVPYANDQKNFLHVEKDKRMYFVQKIYKGLKIIDNYKDHFRGPCNDIQA